MLENRICNTALPKKKGNTRQTHIKETDASVRTLNSEKILNNIVYYLYTEAILSVVCYWNTLKPFVCMHCWNTLRFDSRMLEKLKLQEEKNEYLLIL